MVFASFDITIQEWLDTVSIRADRHPGLFALVFISGLVLLSVGLGAILTGLRAGKLATFALGAAGIGAGAATLIVGLPTMDLLDTVKAAGVGAVAVGVLGVLIGLVVCRKPRGQKKPVIRGQVAK